MFVTFIIMLLRCRVKATIFFIDLFKGISVGIYIVFFISFFNTHNTNVPSGGNKSYAKILRRKLDICNLTLFSVFYYKIGCAYFMKYVTSEYPLITLTHDVLTTLAVCVKYSPLSRWREFYSIEFICNPGLFNFK